MKKRTYPDDHRFCCWQFVSVYVLAEERPLLTATVPFAFTAENTNLPAGGLHRFRLASLQHD